MGSLRNLCFFNKSLTVFLGKEIISKNRILVNIFAAPCFFDNFCQAHAKKESSRWELSFHLNEVTYFARALLASAISSKIPACFLATMALMTSRVTIISATAMMRQITTFWIRPARMKLTKATPATVSA